VVLAPSSANVPSSFSRVTESSSNHRWLLGELQKFRGRIYVADGALRSQQLTPSGRHVQACDSESWHLVSVCPDGSIAGCARLSQWHPAVGFDDLTLRDSAMAGCPKWGGHFREAVRQHMAIAFERGVGFAEVGGWALAEQYRATTEFLRIALGTWALAQLLGGCLGVGTATYRHCSAKILRRLGGAPLSFRGVLLPPYYDARYRCEMEVLGFDSARPESRLAPWLDRIRMELAEAEVVWAEVSSSIRSLPLASAVPVREPDLQGNAVYA
jgi:hypothetical protein